METIEDVFLTEKRLKALRLKILPLDTAVRSSYHAMDLTLNHS